MKFRKLFICGGAALTLPLTALTSCGGYKQNAQGLLMKIFNSYTETYQKPYWDSVENDPLTQRHIHNSTGLVCQCPTDAVLLWAYGPGYSNWNHYLHDGQDISQDETKISGTCGFPSTRNPFNKSQDTHYQFKLKDYQYLDQALDAATAGIPLHAYHGFEPDESDMAAFINTQSGIPGFDITKLTKQQAVDAGFMPNQLVGGDYTDFGFMATALDVTSSMHWIETQTDNKVVPFLEMNLDPSVKGAYISYSNKKFYDGFFLSWPWEYQFLCQRNLKITVTAARWCKSDTDKDLLWMNCNVEPAQI